MRIEYTDTGFMFISENEVDKALIKMWDRYYTTVTRCQPDGIAIEIEFKDLTEVEQ